MKQIKERLQYVNQWNVILYVMTLSQLWVGYQTEGLLHSLWGVGLIWALYMVGYNSLDRELEINLDKAKEAIAKKIDAKKAKK